VRERHLQCDRRFGSSVGMQRRFRAAPERGGNLNILGQKSAPQVAKPRALQQALSLSE
jgi:hypothetical protein